MPKVYAFSHSDAVRTYELTWAIREASERTREARLKASTEAGKAEAESKILSG